MSADTNHQLTGCSPECAGSKSFMCMLFCCIMLCCSEALAQTFQKTGTTVLQATGHSKVAWADYNNDGMPDFVSSGQTQHGSCSTVLFRNEGADEEGNPVFTAQQTFAPVAHGSLAWADVNHDGYLDLHLTGRTQYGQCISQIYVSQSGESLVQQHDFLEGVAEGGARFADFDHDGRQDLVYSGVNDQGKSVLKLYKNQKDGFSEVATSLPGISHGSLEIADYNRDSYTDLLLTGLLEDGSKASLIFRNEGNFRFTQINTVLPPIAFGKAVWGDYNEDAYPDILLSGISDAGVAVSKLYTNNRNGIFTDSYTSLPSVGNSEAVWLDYEQDGALDIFITGLKDSNADNALYRNNRDGTFSLIPEHGITPVYDACISAADFDMNGTLDLLASGYNNKGLQNFLYANTSNGAPNRKPNTPAGLHALSMHDSVTLSWQAATDTETASNGLTYEICIGTHPALADIVAPNSALADGYRKVYAPGNQQYVTQYTLYNLPEGRYYWAVQSVDAAWKASSFSPVDSFDICYPLHLGPDRLVCKGEAATFSIKEDLQSVRWYSSKGFHAEEQHTIKLLFDETDTLWVEAENTLGCLLQDTLVVEVSALPAVSLGSDMTVCYGEEITLEASGKADSMVWYSVRYGLLTGNVQEIGYQAYADDTVWVEAFNTQGCVSADTVLIRLHKQPRAKAGEDQLICRGNSALLGSLPENDSYTYQWSPVYGLDNPASPQPLASPDTTTTYVLQVISPQGCVALDSVTVRVYTSLLVNVIQDTTLCAGESVRLSTAAIGNEEPSTFYEWFPKASLDNPYVPDPVATPDTTTTYMLLVQTEKCRRDTLKMTVSIRELPRIVACHDLTIGYGESVRLKAEGGTQYAWFPAAGLSDTNTAEPLASPWETTTYVVSGYNQYGCRGQDSITVYVDNRIFVPNLFSPNQDGQNDTFHVYGSGIATLLLRIYDAQGKQVYSSANVSEILEQGWDGTYMGNPLPDGHYLWTIQGQYHDGKSVRFEGKTSGKIRLIR